MTRRIFSVLAVFVLLLGSCLFGSSDAKAVLGTQGDPGVPGSVIPFSGVIDFQQLRGELNVGHSGKGRSFVLNVVMTGRGAYHLKMDMVHVPFPFLDVAALIEGDVRMTGDDPHTREFTGELKSSYMLLNYVPLRDANIKFFVRDRKFIVESLWLGGMLGSGEMNLTGKRSVNLNVEVVSADIEEVTAIVRSVCGMQERDFPGLSGIMKGVLNVRGLWPRPYIQGRLTAYNGSIKAFDYDTISLDFEGQYPLLNVKEALVTQAEGLTFRLSGALDIMDWAGIEAQVARLEKAPMISADDNRREWVFKRLKTADDMHTELKYFFLKNDRGDTEAVLGVQKSIGF